MSGARGDAPDAEERTEEVDLPGARKDIGASSPDRPPEFGPTGAEGRGVAGTVGEASTDTSVEANGSRGGAESVA